MSEPTFYDEWLTSWDRSERRRATARKTLHAEEAAFVSTPQDARTAELISSRTGFATWGTTTLISEIPVGNKTGMHSHGEEAMFIVSGDGCSVIGDRIYRWTAGSVLSIPFGVPHQHYNLGSDTVRYLSCMTPDLDAFLGLNRTQQLAEWGPHDGPPDLPVDTHDEAGKRIVLDQADGLVVGAGGAEDHSASIPELTGDGIEIDGIGEMMRFSTTHHHQVIRMMRIGTGLNDFDPHAVEISGVLNEEAGTAGGDHAHMEAHLYILDGEGYTLIDGQRHDWRAGSAVHIPGPQTRHQHFNTGADGSSMLRIAFGIRYLYESVAKNAFPYVYYSGKRTLTDADY